MSIEKMCDEVIHRYDFETKKTISFFRTVEKEAMKRL